MVATSINIHYDTLTALSQAAGRLKKSRREMIVRLLMHVMRDSDDYRREYGAVSYQAHDGERRWHCFSIKFRDDENEFFTDLRKLCKCSVSLLLAIAVKRYLYQIIAEVEMGVYKYSPFRHYMIQKTVKNGVICWKIYWGNPWKPEKPPNE